MTWKSNYRPPFKGSSANPPQKETFTLESDLDFPTLDYSYVETSNVSEIQYNNINNLVNNELHTNNNKQTGWLYLSINPTTNKVCWEDYSCSNLNIAEVEAQEKAEAFLEMWSENFELEKEEFIANYGYDEYKKHYCICDEIDYDDVLSDDGVDMIYDDFGDYSDEDYV